MIESRFSYPPDDTEEFLSWFRNDFSSVFLATNPFLNIAEYPLNPHDDCIPEKVNVFAKKRGLDVGVSWQEIAELCEFRSIAFVNRALRLTGSKRILDNLACPSDTARMRNICGDHNIFIPEEGRFSPLVESSIARMLKQLGHDEVIAAGHFGTSPQEMRTEEFLRPDVFVPPEIHSRDGSIYFSIYIDYHYFLICQTEVSKSAANPADFFEGFFADESTNDFWGIGSLT